MTIIKILVMRWDNEDDAANVANFDDGFQPISDTNTESLRSAGGYYLGGADSSNLG